MKIVQGGQVKFKLGEKILDYHKGFRFFLTTKLSNPHYPPEICLKVNTDIFILNFKVTILNFMVTPEGLEDQMLNIVIKLEEPNKDEQRQRNIKEFFENKAKQ